MVSAPTIEIDGTVYARLGESFSKGDFTAALRGVFPPVYPFFIGLFHLFIPDVELAGRLVSCVAGLLLIYVCFLFLKQFFGERNGLYGAFLVAIHPYLVRFSAQVLSESLATLLFALTVFSFYRGLKDGSRINFGVSGFLLALTYLTRPEYLVFYVPCAIILLAKRRFADTAFFFLLFLVFAFSYVAYMRVETGLWILSKKIPSLDFITMNAFLRMFAHIPYVVYSFAEAMFWPFLVLMFFGVTRIDKSYRNLSLLYVLFHVLSIGFISTSTRRFSVEFFPLMLIYVAQGTAVVKDFFVEKGSRNLLYLLAAVLISISIFQGIPTPDYGRALHKQAGLFLSKKDPGQRIVSRLPFVPFYSGGTWVPITGTEKCPQLMALVKANKARYFVLDDVVQREAEQVDECLKTFFEPVIDLARDKDFVKILRLKNE
jgi:4-amino-4-deoxy-L-arabinose transferase-like glycosyltransferase